MNTIRSWQMIRFSTALLFMLLLCLGLVGQAHAEDNELAYDRTLGDSASMEDDLSKPMDIAIDNSGDVYVADTYNHRIVKYRKDGSFELWGGPDSGNSDSSFNRPTGVAVSPSGQIYVVDSLNNRIQVFDSSGNYQSTIGGYGSEAGKLSNPQGIYIDGSGALYVTEEGNQRVQKLLADGTPVWSTPIGDGHFTNPFAIAMSMDGKLYVSDIINDTITVLTVDGEYLDDNGWGTSGSGDNQFDMPYGLAFDQNNRLYVADRLNQKLKRFTADGLYMDAWDSSDIGDGSEDIFRPQGLEVSNEGELYVLEDYYGSLYVFSPVPVAANLQALTTDAGMLSPSFNPSVLFYQVSVTHSVYSISLTPEPLEPDAVVTIDGVPVAAGHASENIDLPVGVTPIEVKVTSQDGLVSKTYTVQVSRPKSDNARLRVVTSDSGRWNMDFDPDTIAYTIRVDHDVDEIALTPIIDNQYATIEVNGEAHASGSPIKLDSLQVGGENYIDIYVKAQIEYFTRHYRFQIMRAYSPNNQLSGLMTSAGSLSPAFDSETTSYTVTVPYETDTFYAEATTAEPNASIRIFYEKEGEEEMVADELHPLPLSVGDDNILFIGVTAQNGYYKLYSIRVNRELSHQAELSGLSANHGTMSPAIFDPGTTAYRIEVENVVNGIQLTPSVDGAGMLVAVDGESVPSGHESAELPLAVGSQSFEVVVTAMDGVTTKTYHVQVVRAASSNAELVDLQPDSGSLSPDFDSEVTEYIAVVDYETKQISFSPIASESAATVMVNGNETQDGFLSAPIALNEGQNHIYTVVRAQDGATTRTYMVNVVRMPPGIDANSAAGSLSNPYAIGSPFELALMPFHLDGYYRLLNDLDMIDIDWIPIGNLMEPFKGGLDGGGYSIRGLTVDQPNEDYIGLFGVIEGDGQAAAIRNLSLADFHISGKDNVGSLAGYMMNAELEHIFVENSVIEGNSFVGGIAGSAGITNVQKSYAADTAVSGDNQIGGMFGQMQGMTIDQIYTSGSVETASFFGGGLAGSSVSPNIISNIYSESSVAGMGWIGGLVGFPTSDAESATVEMSNSYAVGAVATSEMFSTGGLAADSMNVAAEHSYWVEDLMGQATSAIGEARTALEMTQLAEEGNWDFDRIWMYDEDSPYPQLRAFDHDAWLSGLKLNGGAVSLQPDFSPELANYALTVANAVYEVTVEPSLSGSSASVLIQGQTVTSGESFGPFALDVGENVIIIQVTAADLVTTREYAVEIVRESEPESQDDEEDGDEGQVGQDGDEDQSGNDDPSGDDDQASDDDQIDDDQSGGIDDPSDIESDEAASEGFEILVNGERKEQLGSRALFEEEGRKIVRVHLIDEQLQELLQKETSDIRITMPVLDDVDQVIGQFTGNDVKQLEQKDAILEIVTSFASYSLPANELNIDAISHELGGSASLGDIQISIMLEPINNEELAKLKASADTNNYDILATPIRFRIEAEYEGHSLEIESFHHFIERSLRLPEDLDPEEITTGIVVEQDGSYRHVPTKISYVDGVWYARISSMTNSMYAVVHGETSFADMSNHWAKEAVNELASRRVVKGMDGDSFSPEKAVTRAEFAALLQRALGLREADTEVGATFADVTGNEWYAGAAMRMMEYGIIEGYADGSFRPLQTITREEAMIMTARAARLAKGEQQILTGNDDALLAVFDDYGDVRQYAREAAAWAVKAGVIQGDNGKLLPGMPVTRAESAVIVLRLLQHMKLI